VTFAAYIDVTRSVKGISYITVDSDMGCGIISKHRRFADHFNLGCNAAMDAPWRALDLSQKYQFLAGNRSRLLNLISPKELLRRLGNESKKAIPAA